MLPEESKLEFQLKWPETWLETRLDLTIMALINPDLF